MTERRRFAAALALAALLGATPAGSGRAAAGEALIAVAANFAPVIEALAPGFEAASGHRLVATIGSTGKLYAQIIAGAPFDALLSADTTTPARLEAEGAAVANTCFTYAIGRLALWRPDPDRSLEDGAAVLAKGDFRHLAIANPDLAPYGIAARETLEALGLWPELEAKLVMGQNIGQTHSMVASGAAELGFVALSAVIRQHDTPSGSFWEVPPELFTPIRQAAVLLRPGEGDPAARAFLDYLRSAESRTVIEAFGYALP